MLEERAERAGDPISRLHRKAAAAERLDQGVGGCMVAPGVGDEDRKFGSDWLGFGHSNVPLCDWRNGAQIQINRTEPPMNYGAVHLIPCTGSATALANISRSALARPMSRGPQSQPNALAT
jgi:hypothetical protein